jgi:hypothetical protein
MQKRSLSLAGLRSPNRASQVSLVEYVPAKHCTGSPRTPRPSPARLSLLIFPSCVSDPRTKSIAAVAPLARPVSCATSGQALPMRCTAAGAHAGPPPAPSLELLPAPTLVLLPGGQAPDESNHRRCPSSPLTPPGPPTHLWPATAEVWTSSRRPGQSSSRRPFPPISPEQHCRRRPTPRHRCSRPGRSFPQADEDSHRRCPTGHGQPPPTSARSTAWLTYEDPIAFHYFV